MHLFDAVSRVVTLSVRSRKKNPLKATLNGKKMKINELLVCDDGKCACNICVSKRQKPNAMAIYSDVINVPTLEIAQHRHTYTHSAHLIISSAKINSSETSVHCTTRAHGVASTTIWTWRAMGMRVICFALFVFRAIQSEKQNKKLQQILASTKRKTGLTISLHSPYQQIDVQLYFSSVLLPCDLHASSVLCLPVYLSIARIAIRCSTERPTSDTHTLAHITDANYYVLQQRAAARSGSSAYATLSARCPFEWFIFLLYLAHPFNRVLETKHKTKTK